jgi:hypothetical protein
MMDDQCSGTYLTCLQYFNLSDGAKNNVLNNNNVEQNCTQNGSTSASVSSGATKSGFPTWGYIAIGVGAAIAIVLAVVFSRRKPQVVLPSYGQPYPIQRPIYTNVRRGSPPPPPPPRPQGPPRSQGPPLPPRNQAPIPTQVKALPTNMPPKPSSINPVSRSSPDIGKKL